MKTTSLLAVSFALLAYVPASRAALETYTTTTGVTLDAEVAVLTADAVIFTRPDGLHFTVPLAKLSPSDQARARAQAAGTTAAKPATTPAVASVAAPQPTSTPVNTTPQVATRSSTTAAISSDLKMGPRWRMEARVSMAKKDRLNEEGEIDDRDLTLRPNFDLRNGESKPMEGGTASLIVLGVHVVKKDEFSVLAREDTALTVGSLQVHEYEGKNVTLSYDDKAYSKHGYKYLGYAFLVKNSAGEVVYSKTSLPHLTANLAKVATLQSGSFVKRDFTPSIENTKYYD